MHNLFHRDVVVGSRKSAVDCQRNRITRERTLQICHSVDISSERFLRGQKEKNEFSEFGMSRFFNCFEVVLVELESLVIFIVS